MVCNPVGFFLPKLIFLMFWLQMGPICPKMMGFKFSHPSFTSWGVHFDAILVPCGIICVLPPNFYIFYLIALKIAWDA